MGWSLRVDCLASTPAPLPQRTVGVEDVCVGRMSCRHLMPVCFLGWGVLPGGTGPRLVLSLGKCGHGLSILPWPPRVSVPPGAGWGQAARGVRVLGPHGSQGQGGSQALHVMFMKIRPGLSLLISSSLPLTWGSKIKRSIASETENLIKTICHKFKTPGLM